MVLFCSGPDRINTISDNIFPNTPVPNIIPELITVLVFLSLKSVAFDQKRTIFYRLVAGLCVTDLLGTTLTSPVVIAVYVNNFRWIGGQIMCNYFGYVMILAGYAHLTFTKTFGITAIFSCISTTIP
jgi:hypothetical protein